ncbi:Mediator of RNA polymerase II transcription subunit 12 [Rhizoctonia solani]|uniref:Mediator of RNA polymerase II transcription subunit 12 n=1 Tax=Rhizoctonia solani TaxID=456999 RepID=A0A0K6FXU6_9AGAM|nr:Mediator of RNA polymerase II transcription subunit 12 [Rhizoctonia solani]
MSDKRRAVGNTQALPRVLHLESDAQMPLYLLIKPTKKRNGTGAKGPHDYMQKNRKRTWVQVCYPVDAPQEFDEPGKELDPDAQVWKTYVREADQVDEEMVDGWNKYVSMDVILIFAALFSAISTAFVIESYKNLKQDPADASSQTLLTISQTLLLIANGSQSSSSTPISAPETPAFAASAKDICVNVLWFLSLSLSVAVSLISMLAKEWCLEFMAGRTGPAGAQVRRRQQRWDGLVKWRMKGVIVTLPSLIHLSLLLFAIGLCVFLWDVHFGVAIPVIVVTTIAASAYFACTVVPFVYDFCPYGTVLSRIIKDLITIRPKLNQENPAQDEVTARALQWMIVTCETPRSVDIALQSLAAADQSLPPDELEKVNAWAMIKRRLESTDISKEPEPGRGAGALYKRALEVYPTVRGKVDDITYGVNDATPRLEQLVVGVQSTISGLIHEALSLPQLDQVTARILKRCSLIGPHYLYEESIVYLWSIDKYAEVEPANLVNDITQRLEPYLKGEVQMDSVLYNALSASFAFVMCCNAARGITEQSVNVNHLLQLVQGYSAGRSNTALELLKVSISGNLILGSLWLYTSADHSNSKIISSSKYALMETMLETLWAGLMHTIYSDLSALKHLDVTPLVHGMFYLLANPDCYNLTADVCDTIRGVHNQLLYYNGITEIQDRFHAQYIQDISHNLDAKTNAATMTLQLLQALDNLRYYSPWDDKYILLTPTIYLFVVRFLCQTSDMWSLESYKAYYLLEYSPIPKCSLQLVQQLLADNSITQLSDALASEDLNKQAFATAQLLVFFSMSIHEPDRSNPALNILEQALLTYPGLDKSLEKQEEVTEDLENKLALLLDQDNGIDSDLQSYGYRVLEVMLQHRHAPLHEHAHGNLENIPSRLRGILSCVDLETEWFVVYPNTVLKSKEATEPIQT